VRLATYNLNYSNPDPRGSLDAIAAADADVVLLQEITAGWQRALADRFAAQYPTHIFRLHRRNAGGLAVLSKYPIGGEEMLAPPEGGWFPAQRMVVTSPFGECELLHVHLRPALDHGSWISGFMTTPPVREQEIKSYWKALAHALPVIVAGDFNEDPSGLALAFLEQQGMTRLVTSGPRTWHYEEDAWDVLKMDLDHIVISPELAAHDPRVLDAGTSDHRPVIATLAMKVAATQGGE
jgi:vancomycin resistance protein VanJ